MRDSNWLASETTSNPNLQPIACANIGGRFCYPDTFEQNPTGAGQGFRDLSAGNYALDYNPNNSTWSLDSAGGNTSYYLYLQDDGTYTHTANGASTFGRMINISKNTSSPYSSQNSNWELVVKSVVAWRGKNCPDFTGTQDLLALDSKCKILVEEHLTNWKDY